MLTGSSQQVTRYGSFETLPGDTQEQSESSPAARVRIPRTQAPRSTRTRPRWRSRPPWPVSNRRPTRPAAPTLEWARPSRCNRRARTVRPPQRPCGSSNLHGCDGTRRGTHSPHARQRVGPFGGPLSLLGWSLPWLGPACWFRRCTCETRTPPAQYHRGSAGNTGAAGPTPRRSPHSPGAITPGR